MPEEYHYPTELTPKFYRGFYGWTAKLRIEAACWRKGRRAVFLG